MSEYSVEEVRAEAHRHGDHVADMLTAYADHLDRIKADEVKALGTCPTHGVEYVGECSGCAMTLPEKDFTRPPAQATQEVPEPLRPGYVKCQQCDAQMGGYGYGEFPKLCPVCQNTSRAPTALPVAQLECPKCHGTGEVSDCDGLYAGQCTACRSAEPVAQGEVMLDRAVLAYRMGCTGSVEGHNHRAGIAAVIEALAAQPRAVPSERVAEDVERDAARYRFIRDEQATIIYKRKQDGEWVPLVDTYSTSTLCASLDTAIDTAMLATTPSPGESNNKPTDCSGDPSSCPDNEGRGCYCSDLRRVGESA